MAILKPSYGALITESVTGLSTLLNTADVSGDNIHDNPTDLFIDIEFTIAAAAVGPTTGTLDVYLKEGLQSGILSTKNKISNLRRIGSLELNGTSNAVTTFLVTEVAPFWRLYFINNAGADLASASVYFRGINYTDI